MLYLRNTIVQSLKMWLRQLKVVLWKNIIIRKRHWFLTICEALIPVLLFLLIAYGRSKITGLNKTEVTEVTYSEKVPIFYASSGINLEETQFYFAPSSDFFADLIHRIQIKFQITNNNIKGFDTKEHLLEEYARSNNRSTIAIIFNSNKTSPHFDYTIRTHESSFSWRTHQLYDSQYQFVPQVGSTYLWKGFLAIQKAVDLSFIEKISGRETNVSIQALEFPYPPYKSDSGISSLFIHYLPLITMFSFIFVCPAVLKRVVEEKYSGIKELMKMVGMKSWMLWLGWFIYSVIPMILSVLLITFLLKVDVFGASYPAIEFANSGILIVFLILYCMAATVFCFFISTLFSKPMLATLVGVLVWILSYFVPKYLLDGRDGISFSLKMLVMLFPNMALNYGYQSISYYEEREIGIKWSNLNLPGGGGATEVTMFNVWEMLIVDIIFFMVLTYYFDSILPGKYGIPKSIFFPLKRFFKNSLCIRFFSRRTDVESNETETVSLQDIEQGHFDKSIVISDLTKQYGIKKVVNKLRMAIYKNQITVLLGHNGAGKSTTMGMITGMIKKTEGHIFINGKSIDSSYNITDTIGLCPQHNLLFPDLTVAEHLIFFAMLRGKTYEESKIETINLLSQLNLLEKQNKMASTLSGGMQRKLCLGMAVVGEPKILILDEPSSGMDPESRRHMWDLLLKWRSEKTILITTHFMEEADALGDWIAIMNEGTLRCYGTPMYLKKKFETGFNLSLLIKKDADVNKAVENLEEELRNACFVNNFKCKSVNGNEVVFLLPFGNTYIKMFEHLENEKDRLNIENISFTSTTLEDVFLNSKPIKEEDQTDTLSINSTGEHDYTLTLRALAFKRLRFLCRKLRTYLIPSIIAVLFLGLCIYLGQGANDYYSSGGPALKMKLSTYGKTTVMFKNSDDPGISELKKFYQKLVTEQSSVFTEVNDVSEGIVEAGIKNLPYYRQHMVVAGEFAQDSEGIDAVAMYNNLALHSAPISLNLLTNTLAKAILGEQYSISMTSHPLDHINSDMTVEELSEVQIGLLWLSIMPLGFLFFLGSFVYFPYVELSTNFTQLQLMCGVSPWLYWITTYVFDFIIYIQFALLMALISMAWTPFQGINQFGTLFLILTLYGICGIPYTYLFSRKKRFSGAYAAFIITGIMMGILFTVIVSALEQSKDDYYIGIADKLKIILLIICPQFGLTYSGVKFSNKVIYNYNFDHMSKLKRLGECSRDEPNPCCFGNGQACEEYRSYLSVLTPEIWWMLLGAVLFLLINISIHSYPIRKFCNTVRKHMYRVLRKGNSKTLTVFNNQNINDNNKYQTLRVRNLKKSYSGNEVVNIEDFNLKKGECMGILGVNGAGKTTTFRMLTREEIKDNGDIKINNFKVDNEEYLRKLGYCPQNDALNYSLTGREILRTMALLRGIRDEKVVDEFLKIFELTEYADIPCEYYSGGNKRKLSFAVAVIGLPDVILLDEPTNGVDPISRRKLWSLIRNIKNSCQNSFVLTSHSMVECEALCNDLNIMKAGTIKRKGTISQLKEELCGFSVKLKIKTSINDGRDEFDGASRSTPDQVSSPNETRINIDDSILNNVLKEGLNTIKKAISEKYKAAEIKDEHSGLIHYYIKTPGKNVRWSQIFKDFEDIKSEFSALIEDYSISEASLEDVFLDVARETDGSEEQKGNKKNSRPVSK